MILKFPIALTVAAVFSAIFYLREQLRNYHYSSE